MSQYIKNSTSSFLKEDKSFMNNYQLPGKGKVESKLPKRLLFACLSLSLQQMSHLPWSWPVIRPSKLAFSAARKLWKLIVCEQHSSMQVMEEAISNWKPEEAGGDDYEVGILSLLDDLLDLDPSRKSAKPRPSGSWGQTRQWERTRRCSEADVAGLLWIREEVVDFMHCSSLWSLS